ncbi:hypothetical protein [Pedomonas mirosovicensis]|uniref:hypothetical protein n=1 Tax=Pedomonas mirosovicensis TaxID=2908641 RepID=UPI002168C61F|nr:hypothetical protein [Pedomonas mirosovicensis]MCH8683869.1 hypothetical protein [Pedomonas mirosovicensis]
MDPGAPDSSLILPLRFQIGERTLATVRRRLLSRSQDLESLLDAADVTLPPLPPHADGLLLRSVASDQLGTIEARADDLLLYVRQRYPRHYARLEGSFEEYLAGFSPKSRSTLKRKVRRFEQLSGGRLDVREYRTPVQMETFHALARLVSKKPTRNGCWAAACRTARPSAPRCWPARQRTMSAATCCSWPGSR